MKRKAVFVSILAATITVMAISLNFATADTAIPQWIRNSAKYWSEGGITDAEYIQGIQYLISQGIIQVTTPVTQVIATNGGPSDADRVTSLVIHFKNFVNTPSDLPSEIKIDTFQRVYEFGQTSSVFSNTGVQTNIKANPQFQLDDLPSKDKSEYYKLVNSAISLSQNAQNTNKPTFDVLIDLYTGDGTLLHTLEYTKCTIVTYFLFTNGDKNDYRMSSSSQDAEHREVTNFDCQGYHIDFPSK